MPLYTDASTGVIFNFAGNVTVGDEILPNGVIMVLVSKQPNIISVLLRPLNKQL